MNDRNTVWAFGDSYTVGYDLSDFDEDANSDNCWRSEISYSALVAKELNYNYNCKAQGYYANNAICRTIIENINNIEQDDLVLVMWTFPIRREFLMEDTGLQTIGRESDHEFAKHYLKYIDLNDSTMFDLTLKDIYTAQALLQNHNYLFLNTVTEISQKLINLDEWSSPLAERINLDRWVMLDGLGFHEWSEQQLGIKYTGHPTDQAHDLLARKILERT